MTKVLVKNNKTGRWSPTMKVDDHYVVLTEPENNYLTHVTPKTVHGKVVARAIYDFLVEHELTNQPLYVAGCDGCCVNTGPNRGVIHHLEMLLIQPLHYSICQLHGNELPFQVNILLQWQAQRSRELARNDWSADKTASVRPSCH